MDIRGFRSLFPDGAGDILGSDFYIVDMGYNSQLRLLSFPFRFDGYVAIFCFSGNISMDINLNTYEIKPHSLLLSIPGNILRVSKVNADSVRDVRFLVIAMSKEFISTLHFDFNRLFNDSLSLLENPCVTLGGNNLKISTQYIDLASEILRSDVSDKHDIIATLMSSLFNFYGSIWTKLISDVKAFDEPQDSSTRIKVLFDRFLKLVTEYHTSQRNMSFYAEKLCLTPKYLSKLIKKVSGRSAPDWIDAFVILEAKNLLKYSNMPIKEVVFKLHFPNQSVFYKYFKAHTGMTPTEYRNS